MQLSVSIEYTRTSKVIENHSGMNIMKLIIKTAPTHKFSQLWITSDMLTYLTRVHMYILKRHSTRNDLDYFPHLKFWHEHSSWYTTNVSNYSSKANPCIKISHTQCCVCVNSKLPLKVPREFQCFDMQNKLFIWVAYTRYHPLYHLLAHSRSDDEFHPLGSPSQL